MTTKYFILAAILKKALAANDAALIEGAAEKMADYLKTVNPNFNAARFVRAVKGEK